MSNQRQSYHSDLKLAVQLECVPTDILSRIPRSSRHRFKYSDYSSFYGSELSSLFENMDLIKEIAQSKSALKTAQAVLRVASFVRSLGPPFHELSRIRSPVIKQSVVAFVHRLSSSLPKSKILRFLGMPMQSFSSWARGRKLCPSSPLTRCRRSYPHQLMVFELRAIKKAFLNPDFSSWPASSIAWKLIHERIVCASVATITGYAKLLGFSHRKLVHRSRKRGSLSAVYPNEAWHLDATVLFTKSHEKAYLQFVLDNFSKRIIAWQCTPSISGMKTTDLLRSAFGSISSSQPDHIDLIVDGGPENNNRIVSAFLEDTPIRKLVARVDVSFSNSMIEAVNKILKYRYIFRTPVPDLYHVNETIAAAIEDYNDRPHYALKGLSPNQVYTGCLFDKADYRESLMEARTRRLIVNRQSCEPCVPLDLDSQEVIQ